MPRQAREKSGTGIYHVMLRGVNKQNIFEDDEDRLKFLTTIKYYKKISNYKVYGYCLMNNHIHLLLKENEETLSTILRRISSSYVRWYNEKYLRCGHLFQERFKSEVVETQAYFLTVLRYIHQNPIKAGMTKNLQYKWSSYQDYLHDPIYTDIDFVLQFFSIERTEALKSFQNYMNKINNDTCMDFYDERNVTDEEIIEQIQKLGIKNISELQKLKKDQRDEIIRLIKKIEGVRIRQLSRITGLSKSVIGRI